MIIESQPSPQLKVLVIEDSPLVRQRLIAMLTDLREVAEVSEAEGARQGTALIRTLQPDLVVLDLKLPDGSGFDVLNSARSIPQAPLIAVLTNCASPEYRQRCLELGAAAFLDKSMPFNQLKTTITELLRKKSSRGQEERAGGGQP